MRQDVDGFDNYNTITTRYEATQLTNGGIVFGSTFARFAAPSPLVGQGIKVNQNSWCRKNLLSNQGTLILGFAWSPSALPSSGADAICDFQDNGTLQCTLEQLSNGAFQIVRGGAGGTTLGTSSPGMILGGNFYWIEFVVTFGSGTAGSVALYVNQGPSGTAAINVSGINTITSANAYANQYRLLEGNAVSFYYFDDLYCFDTTGGVFNARLGDQRMLYLPPASAGASTQFTPTGAATNWQAASQNPPSPATIYNASSTAGQEDLFNTPAVSESAAPNGVWTRRLHYKTDAAAHTDQSAMKSGSTTTTSTAVAVPSSATYQDDDFPNDPNTGSPWASWAALNSAEVGYVETS